VPATEPRYQRLERDARREQILAAARRLYAEQGAAAVSTSAVAREAGVTRGLLHHHFGTKRDLELEVIRSMLRWPAGPEPADGPGSTQERLAEATDRWLAMLERHREPWLLAQGMGSDPEVHAILEQSRASHVQRLAEALSPGDERPELLAALRAYSGFAEAASLEWLVRDRLTRRQLRTLLLDGLDNLVTAVLPAVVAAKEGES
jgi:AcrR family transcriptional regulator